MTRGQPPDGPPPGLHVGDYELIARIGEGGMGVVHLGRGPEGGRVAIKVLRPHVVGDEEARERLAREVGSLGRVRSPRVAEIVDADPWGPIPFVATRYVPGLSLHDHVREHGPLQGEDLRWFAGCLAEALAAVHEVGVLHRDVKPSNVLMEGRSPVLIDFGLARLADDPRLTQTGWLMGTPGYLAPEVLAGEEPTPASDVHAWAATVAYAATGRSPYGRGPSMAVLDRVRRGEHDLTGVPADLAPLLRQALDPDPRRRPDVETLRRAGEADPGTPTMPIAAVGARDAEEATRGTEVEDPTLVQRPVEPTPSQPAPAPGHEEPGEWAGPHRESWAVRLRRGVLVLAAAGAGGAATSALPWPSLVALLLLVWLLRSLSLAASATDDLRRWRGRRWYDAPRALVTAPWHALRAVPGALLLLAWAAGAALAAGLVCYALALGLVESLAVCGSLLWLAAWLGPGAARFRRPARRVLDPLSRSPVAWVVAVGVVLVVAGVAGYAALSGGPDWFPSDRHPLAPGTFLGDAWRSLPGR